MRKTTMPSILALWIATAAGCSQDVETTPGPSEAAGGATAPPESAEDVAAERDLQAPLLEGLGDHHHSVTTDSPLVQRLFDQGMMLHFGFNHAEAVRSFAEGGRLDPGCASCFMGVALSLGPNINAPMDPDDVERAHRAIDQAMELRDQVTARERALIEAVAERYAAEPPEDRTELDEAYARAMGEVVQAHPEDMDAAALYAEALMVLHPWDYWADDGEPKPWTPRILEVLEGVLEREPEHPFANHLYIHAVEASDEPERGLANAKRLEGMVPGAGHLVHMPAHIYIRTGDYHRASQANERAIAADEAYLEQVKAQGLYPLAYYPHNYHFLWATTTLEGRSEDAIAAARGVAARADRDEMRKPGFGTLQHYLSIPYYALVAFGRWEALVEEPAPEEDLLYPQTVWRYGRGMAFAARGEVQKAQEALRAVREAAEDETLEEVTIWDINSTSNLMRIGAEILAARIDRERGRTDAEIEHLRRAVDLEDGLNYDEPPPWGPATRRYLGAALLRAGRAREAEQVYREDLEHFPDNGWSLFGLVKSLRARGESEEARKAQQRFERAWRHADVVLTSSVF